MKKLSLPFVAFLQTTGLVVYIGLISLLFLHGQEWFGRVNSFYGPIFFLLLFVISAVISAILILGRAGFLFWEKRYKEAFTLLGWTVGWGIFYLAVLALILFMSR